MFKELDKIKVNGILYILDLRLNQIREAKSLNFYNLSPTESDILNIALKNKDTKTIKYLIEDLI